MGKGSKRRPQQINDEIIKLRWQLIFEVTAEREKERLKEEIGQLERELYEADSRRS